MTVDRKPVRRSICYKLVIKPKVKNRFRNSELQSISHFPIDFDCRYGDWYTKLPGIRFEVRVEQQKKTITLLKLLIIIIFIKEKVRKPIVGRLLCSMIHDSPCTVL